MLLESLKAFFIEYWVTILVSILSSVCCAAIVDLYKKGVFTKLEEHYKDNESKLTIVKVVKSTTSIALASILTTGFLFCIHKSSLPCIGDEALMPIWATAMYLLQLYIGMRGVKTVMEKVLGTFVAQPKEKKKKMKKVVTYVEANDEA